MAKTEKTNIKKPQETMLDAAPQKDARVEFEQRFDFFMTKFRIACEEAKVPVAVAIVLDIENPTTPFIYTHGHIYDQATLLAQVLRDLKRKMGEELSA
jgi:hypothetical protein